MMIFICNMSRIFKKGSVDKSQTHEICVLLKILYVVKYQANGMPQLQKSELSQPMQKAQKPSVMSSHTGPNISFCLKYFLLFYELKLLYLL